VFDCSDVFIISPVINAINRYQQNGQGVNPNGYRRMKNSCLVLISEREYEGRREEQPLECELRGEDLNGTNYKLVRIKNLKSSWARKNSIQSGVTTLFADDFMIDESANEIVFRGGEALKVNILIVFDF
jgi:hypothetical protein